MEAKQKSLPKLGKIAKNKIIRMAAVGMALAFTMFFILIATIQFGLLKNDELKGPPPIEKGMLGGLNRSLWEAGFRMFLVAIVLPFFVGIFITPAVFFASFPTILLASLTKQIWNPTKRTDLFFVCGSYLLGMFIFSILWIAMGYIRTPIPCFYLAPITNLTLPLATFLFFHAVKKNEQAEEIAKKVAKLKPQE
jgi:hypothetical protein